MKPPTHASVSALLSRLPPHLAERARVQNALALRPDGACVVYAMRVAARGHENAALDVALSLGRALGLPVFVFHALSERYAYASDRFHRFILEGARDVQAELAARGIGYAFHPERPGHRGPHLKTLAHRAALVVTEEMPMPTLRTWTHALARDAGAPVLTVDASCVVPIYLHARPMDRAFAYRKATATLARDRLLAPWPEQPVHTPPYVPPLPFEPVDLQTADLHALVRACNIDHAVAPVPDTVGGSRAGYARWDAFRAHGLGRYGARRNDASIHDGVSRMSAYLHFGHVSALRLARDAQADGGDGATKYLDELLIWRELAWQWALHQPDPEAYDALPEWARDTLATLDFPRALSDEELALGRTGDALWDACQHSLRVHGELHNNVRMTWGKAVLQWAADGPDALRRLVDLNHRYALDGRDPASCGGLLWCLGLFDHPFSPRTADFGVLRPRRTSEHVRRLPVASYRPVAERPRGRAGARVLVVGAGISGAAAAAVLRDHGVDVEGGDRGRAPGGRASTRRSREHPQLAMDHGAVSFTAQDAAFLRSVRSWEDQGWLRRWEPRTARWAQGAFAPTTPPRQWVALPGMDQLCAHLLQGIPVHAGTEVTELVRVDGRQEVRAGERGFTPCDVVVVATAATQASRIRGLPAALTQRALAAPEQPALSLMLHLAQPLLSSWDVVDVEGHPLLRRVVRDSAKPGRPPGERWVVQTTPEAALPHLEHPEGAAPALLAALAELCGPTVTPTHTSVHRWGLAHPGAPSGQRAWVAAEAGVVAAGDWLVGAGVENAWLSGVAAAAEALNLLR